MNELCFNLDVSIIQNPQTTSNLNKCPKAKRELFSSVMRDFNTNTCCHQALINRLLMMVIYCAKINAEMAGVLLHNK